MADIQPPSDWLHAVVGIKSAHVVAGVLGGVARGLVSRGFSWSQRIGSAVIGAIVAGYGTPAAAAIVRHWLSGAGYPPSDIEGSVGFALGLVGMTLCDVLIRRARQWWGAPHSK